MASNVSTDQQRALDLKQALDLKSNREYQSTVFTAYFGEAANAAQLYEGIVWLENHEKEREKHCRYPQTEATQKTSHKSASAAPEDIVFATLEGVLYLARKNDLAFTVKKKVLVIGEHQSTVNRNMPLRSAIYYGRTMEKLIDPKVIYKSQRISIPTPEFYVFYNGKEPQPLEQTLYLSDSYLEKTDHPMLQLEVKVININLREGHPLLERCRPLYEYSWFTWKVRECLEGGHNRDEAIAEAMKASIKQGILTDFIRKHGSEVRNMLFTEFNLDIAREVWEEEARAEGHAEGRAEGRVEGRAEGRAEGADYNLIEMITKKLKKGKGPEIIADELETPVEKIQEICRTAAAFAPDYDPDAILAAIRK